MVHDSMSNLKIDQRLLGRRGWIRAEELEKELQDLPDVSDKGELVGDAEQGEASPAPDAPTGPSL